VSAESANAESDDAMAPRHALRDALRNLSLKAVSLGLERGGRFLVAVAAAACLGQTSFGRFVFASTVTAMLAFGTDLGLSIWTTRTLARDRSDGERVLRLGLALRLIAALPYAFAIAAMALVVGRGEARSAIAWLGVAALLNAFADHFAAVLRGYERFADEARLNALRAILTTVAGLLALGIGRSLGTLCAGTAAASLGGFLYGLVMLVMLVGIRQVKSAGGAFADRGDVWATLRQSLPIWFAGLLSLLYFKVDTLFLHAMTGDAELGAYGAAYKLFEGALLLPVVLLSVTFPQLARTHGDPLAQRRLERRLTALLLGLGLGVGAVYFFGRGPLIDVVFGADFRRAKESLAVLALGLPVLYVNFGLTHFLVARDRERATTLLALMMLGLNVALDVALIPHGGGPGAAGATVLSELALTAGCLLALHASGHEETLTSTRAAARTDQRAA
jgi:O-antigen/teichoic acid export membrane protein